VRSNVPRPAGSATLPRIRPTQPSLPSVSRRRPLVVAALLIGAVTLGAIGAELALMRQPPAAPWPATLFLVAGAVYVATGLSAWLRRPSSRLGVLLVVGGLAWLLAGLLNTGVPALVGAGFVTSTLPLAVIVHLLVGFPSGRLRGVAERTTVAVGYVTCLVLQAPRYLYTPGTPLSIADHPDVVDASIVVQRVVGALVVIATAALLVRRIRRGSPAQRRVLAPLAGYGIFAVLLIPVSSAVANQWFDGGGIALPTVQLVVMTFVPVAFAIAASRGGFRRTTDVAELGAWLGAGDRERPALGEALASALGDASLRLLFRVPGERQLVDDQGRTVPADPTDPGRGRVDVGPPDDPIGAIEYDAQLLDRPDEVAEAGRVVALALDRERLTADLRASRARIAAAGDAERRRIARDLHDGLQARLVFLGVQLGVDGAPAATRANLQTAIDELRELVDGVMPAPLTERGLPSAVADLADRSPLPVSLRVTGCDARLGPEIETAAYFLVAEALGNAVKHSRATALEVSLERIDDELQIAVLDDGIGGAREGRGIRGIADRVHAHGGTLAVESEIGSGTRVQAVIPCAS
jgi:signal transduction histidine kinase